MLPSRIKAVWSRLSACRRVANPPERRLPTGAQLSKLPRKLPHKKALLLLAAVAALCLAQTASQMTPQGRRVGDRLACLCGACKNTVTSCPMLGCHYASPARERIMKLLAAGMSEQGIVDEFVKEQGLQALAVPPAEGFNVLAWIMPFVAIGLGLMAIWLWIKKFHPKRTDTVPDVPPEVLARYKDRIDQDLAKQQED